MLAMRWLLTPPESSNDKMTENDYESGMQTTSRISIMSEHDSVCEVLAVGCAPGQHGTD